MRGMGKKISILLLTAATLALGGGTALAMSWTFTDLSQQGDFFDDSYAHQINENGDIVGSAIFAGYDYHELRATLWSGGVATNLGDLGGISTASSINDAGVIVGNSYIDTSPGGRHAVLYSTSAPPVDVHPDIPSVQLSESRIAGINASGQMAGTGFSNLYLDQVPIRWSDFDTYEVLDAGELNIGHVNRINNLGQMIGGVAVSSVLPNGYWQYGSHAAFWDADGTLTMFGEFDGYRSFAHGLNDLGQVVLSVTDESLLNKWSIVWQDGEVLQRLVGLGGRATEANAINNSGLIVGSSQTVDGERHAVAWLDGELIDLNDFVADRDLVLVSAGDINEQGQIVGYGTREDSTRDGVDFAFLLTPTGTDFTLTVTPTPVPASVLLFGSGLAGLVLFRRKAQA